jgi:hypothetical protein
MFHLVPTFKRFNFSLSTALCPVFGPSCLSICSSQLPHAPHLTVASGSFLWDSRAHVDPFGTMVWPKYLALLWFSANHMSFLSVCHSTLCSPFFGPKTDGRSNKTVYIESKRIRHVPQSKHRRDREKRDYNLARAPSLWFSWCVVVKWLAHWIIIIHIQGLACRCQAHLEVGWHRKHAPDEVMIPENNLNH